MDGTKERWANSFPVLVNELLDPESTLSKKYPHLHYNLRHRLEGAFIARKGRPVSSCTHTVFDEYSAGRSDELCFQENEDTKVLDIIDPIIDTSETRADYLCPNLLDRMELYGVAGTGTFGTVYLARERENQETDSNNLNHYAIKVEKHHTLLSGFLGRYFSPPMTMILEESKDARYIPTEAFIMLLLTTSNRFPTLDSVYIHDRFQAIVMSPCVDYASDLRPLPEGGFRRLFSPFTGKYLMTSDGRPLLDEMQASKVASQILQGLVELADLNLWHNDLSINNFVVDQQLNVTIIDLGDVRFGLEDSDFIETRRGYLPFQEHQMSPELARALSVQGWFINRPRDRHDIRQVILWKFGVLLFGILHGYWPWDDQRQGHRNLLYFGSSEREILRVIEKRARMMNDPLIMNDNLSQDCKDLLQDILAPNPNDRPSLQTLASSYPWFLQWTYADRVWRRPFSEDFYRHSFQ